MSEQRKTGGFSFFALWFGAAVSLAEIMTGSLIAPLGIGKGILAILLGHLAGCLILAAVGTIGFREKKPSLLSSRISLGRYGSYLISIFNIIQLIGWTAIMLIQCARSMQSVTSGLFGFNNYPLLAILAGVFVAVWALFADKGIHMVNNVAVVLLAALSIGMLILILKSGHAQPVTGSLSFGAAFELSLVMALSWVPLISDYTMNGKSRNGSIIGSFTGYFIGSCLMYVIGLVAAVFTGNSDPIGVMSMLGAAYPALMIVILATVTTTFMDVYSSVMSTLNLAPKASRKVLVLVFSGLGTLLALFFPMEQYENFLYMIGSLFAPIFSVILVDYFIFRKDRSASIVNIPGIAAAAAGTAAYYLAGGFDLPLGSSIPSMIAAAAVYVLLRLITKILKLGEVEYVK